MTIRRRLLFSFAAILVLFAVSQAIFLWTLGLREDSVQSVSRALNRQVIIGGLRQNIDDLDEQITLLTHWDDERTVARELHDSLSQKLSESRSQLAVLHELSDPEFRSQVDTITAQVNLLFDSWHEFLDHVNGNRKLAAQELLKAEPFVGQLLNKSLPNLQDGEEERQRVAQEKLEKVTRITERTVTVIFVVSIAIAGFVAFRMSRYISERLSDLIAATDSFSRGNMEHRIDIRSHDEIGQLARSFNSMGLSLAEARATLVSANKELERHTVELENEKRVSESLLLNILPDQVARELQDKGSVEPMYFEDVTIVFTDFVGFTLSTERLAAEDLVSMLHDYFTAFDQIVGRYHLEKLKTIGDSYMCVSGLPVARRGQRVPSHPVDAVLAAFEMVSAVQERQRNSQNDVRWSVRVGIHTGPVVAGVVGIQKFAFDVWGDTVNFASRMESSGLPNRINMSSETYRRVKDFFACEHRGKVMTKDKRETDMYFANGILPDLLESDSPESLTAFLRRYRVYFQKDPPNIPGFLTHPSEPPETKTISAGA
jgi:class 3 adenylate cyclase/HAMP domain-containing protein